MGTYGDYVNFLEELCRVFDRLGEIEGKKVEAVQRKDLDALNACMKEEQALSLALRGYEARREELLRALGLLGVPLREVPRHCPADQRQAVSQAVERTLRAYQVLTSAQEPARLLLEQRLRLIDGELQRRGMDPEDGAAPAPFGGRRPSAGTDIKV